MAQSLDDNDNTATHAISLHFWDSISARPAVQAAVKVLRMASWWFFDQLPRGDKYAQQK